MPPSTHLYRFRFDLSDVDRSLYEQLDFRLAQHPSETVSFLLTRAIAFALNVEPGLDFSKEGLCEPDDPCISSPDPRGGLGLWIEVGNPSARRLHKAAKAAKRVKVYTYKNPESLLRELEKEKIHNLEQIEIYSLDTEFLGELEAMLERDNEWNLIRDQDSLMVSAGERSCQGTLARHFPRKFL
jgi:uncharacterized protein YaeQ